jgi:hypothetical protein|tara:strand:+ start:1039 stop:1413 length:375 start_codon:yes stop_codon:yes gene_type:complete
MPRPKRKEIKLTHESAVALMQEIYNECVEQRTTAIRIQNKMIGFMKEAADMALIGPVLKEQQKIIDSSIDKKLQLSKLISAITSKNIEQSGGGLTIDSDIKESIQELVAQSKKDEANDDLTYNI